ncbi:MAG: YtxH domain-containing protein [bacterium]
MTDCSCSNHYDSTGFTTGLLLGLVTGAASAHFLLNTNKGKELINTLKENAGDAMKELGDNPQLADKIADLQKTMDQARATINSAAEKVAEVTEDKKPTPKKNFFQRMGASLGK